MTDSTSESKQVKLIEALNRNMNEEFKATLQYICHRIASKDQNNMLAESFKTAALDEMTHILYFSDLITKYGGKPRPIKTIDGIIKPVDQKIIVKKLETTSTFLSRAKINILLLKLSTSLQILLIALPLFSFFLEKRLSLLLI